MIISDLCAWDLYRIRYAFYLEISIKLAVFLLKEKHASSTRNTKNFYIEEKKKRETLLVALINIISREKKLLMYRSIGETFTG